MKRAYEVRVGMPSGCRLVGCRTEGDDAIVIFEDASGPEVRPIGFCREHPGTVAEGDEDE